MIEWSRQHFDQAHREQRRREYEAYAAERGREEAVARQNADATLAAFLAGPRGDCGARLQAAVDATAAVIQYDADGAAPALLDMADAAAGHGCPGVARDLYNTVIQTFVGWGFAAYRQRAEIGPADLRAAR
jgi:hypothetical protein